MHLLEIPWFFSIPPVRLKPTRQRKDVAKKKLVSLEKGQMLLRLFYRSGFPLQITGNLPAALRRANRIP